MQVKLSSNAWHAKLHIWTFGEVQLRHNLCPYFWLTVFCIIVSPVVGLFKVIRALLLKAVQPIDQALDYIENRKKQRAFEKKLADVKRLSLFDAYLLYQEILEIRKLFDMTPRHYYNPKDYMIPRDRKLYEKWELWESENPEWEKLFQENKVSLDIWLEQELVRQKQEEELRQKLREEENEQIRAKQQLMHKIAYYTQHIVKALAVSIASACIGLVMFAAVKAILITPFMFLCGLALFIVGTIGCCGGLFVVIAELADYFVERENPVKEEKKPGLLKLYFQAAKENYCPRITWE